MKPISLLVSFAVGLVFALGLGISGMTQPDKVIGFLDFLGSWDPALMGVMGGGVVVYLLLHRVVVRRGGPVLGDIFQIPQRTDITPRLVAGSAMFGVGWGLGGFCPGPALTALPSMTPHVLVFAGSMFAGMLLFRVVDPLLTRRADAKAERAGADA